ncbi:sensor histidine kinase [Stackebrandtia nassauensis]|uniref:histidine kinase n=1 Tax=Stackebrandtia nassauensis (strain DSM 44728 / CIP 108903 / NRRL B-16338 / NBRC 102104 / LLR-40K-21) TaxID=446470 RepID=D3Q3A0_STANL|nr:histidine kinase [Stackebrandtia nassauensis]ADD41941.1 histidine kinase [Stackebrandtia nassauensis DSM 44728]
MRSDVWRRTAPDVAVATLAVGFGVVTTWRSWGHDGAPGWLSAGAVIGAGLAMAFARRLPVPVLGVLAVLLLVTDHYSPFAANPVQFLLLLGLGYVAFTCGWPTTIACYVVALVTTAVNLVDAGSGVSLTWWRVAGVLVVLAAPIAFGRYLAGLRAVAALNRARARETAERVQAEAAAARLAERARIARDLHDIVAHHVGAMVLRAGAAQYAGAPPPVAEALGDIRSTGTQVLEDLRGLLAVLRDPAAVEGAPSVSEPEAVMTEAVERSAAAGLRLSADIDPAAATAPMVVRATAARLVQEGLTNVLKHAGPGTDTRVTVTAATGTLTVEVVNDAPETSGPRPLPSTGYGLSGMRERVAMLDGHLEAGPTGTAGWRLSASIPYGSQR